MTFLPRENWTLVPYRWGLQKVLIGTDASGTPHYQILPRNHPHDKAQETTVQWQYCGSDAAEAHRSKISILPLDGDYCPFVAGHGQITQEDVAALRANGDEGNLADFIQDIIDGQITDPVKVLVTRGAMRGRRTLSLEVIFLGDVRALAEFAQEQRIERAAERLVAAGGTVAAPPVNFSGGGEPKLA